MRAGNKPRLWLAITLALFAAAGGRAAGETGPSDPSQLVARAVQNEIAANAPGGMHFMFRNEKRTTHSNQVKLIVETRESAAGMLIEEDGHALTPEQRQAEEARLQNYVQNPDQLNRKRKQEKEDSERTIRIVKALPAAFIYEEDGTQQGTASVGSPQDELVRLKFRPNPNYEPPSRVEQALTGMHGHVLIDAKQAHLAEIDGTLEKEVGFGWGILGHLDKGGRFLVQQADVGGHQWELTRMELSFTGKILLFKKLTVRSSDTFSDFHPVASDLTFAQGVALLEKEAARIQSQTPKANPGQPETKPPADGTKEQTQEALCCDH